MHATTCAKKRTAAEDFGPLANLSFGSLYPALARPRARWRDRTVEALPQGPALPEVPFTGSLAGERAATVAPTRDREGRLGARRRGTRARKVYELTHSERSSSASTRGAAGERHRRPALLRASRVRPAPVADRTPAPARAAPHGAERSTHTRERSLVRPGRSLDTLRALDRRARRDGVAADLCWVERLIELERTSSSGMGTSAGSDVASANVAPANVAPANVAASDEMAGAGPA